jgi:hypothetical protein
MLDGKTMAAEGDEIQAFCIAVLETCATTESTNVRFVPDTFRKCIASKIRYFDWRPASRRVHVHFPFGPSPFGRPNTLIIIIRQHKPNDPKMAKTYHGSCICKAIKFEVDVDFSEEDRYTGKCNCTICTKLRFWSVIVKPSEFRFIPSSPDVTEESVMTTHIGNKPGIRNSFCKTCGVHVFHRVDIPEWIDRFVSVNVGCLDDVEAEFFASLRVRFVDGRNNNWTTPPKITSYL